MPKFSDYFRVAEGSLLAGPLAWLVIIGLMLGLGVRDLVTWPQLLDELDSVIQGASIWVNLGFLAVGSLKVEWRGEGE